MKEPLEISTREGCSDYKLFVNIWNKGIDSRLEAFTKSTYSQVNGRLYLSFHPEEIQLLLRRLIESPYLHELAWGWADDIVSVYYGIEII